MNQEITKVSVPPNYSLETSMLIKAIQNGKPGDVMTDEELTKVCGKQTAPHGEGYSYLMSAIRHVLREHRILWKRIREKGCIKCLGNEECLMEVRGDLKATGRKARRARTKLVAIDNSALSHGKRLEAVALEYIMGMVAKIGKPSIVKRLTENDEFKPPPLKELMDNILGKA